MNADKKPQRSAEPKRDPKSGTWWFVVDGTPSEDGQRRQIRRRGFRTRKAAKQELNRLRIAVQERRPVAPARLKFGEYLVKEWLPAMKSQVRPSTWESYERNVRVHVRPALGGLRLAHVTASRLNAFYTDLAERGRRGGSVRSERPGLSARTVAYVHTIVSRALRDAVDSGLLPHNPAAAARPPKQSAEGRPEMATWSAEELRGFLEAVADDPLHPAFLTAATTGMRRGEVLGLRWRDLDLTAGRAGIRQTVVCVAHEVRFSEPKTRKARRSVPLPPETVAVLRAHRKAQNERRLIVGHGYDAEADLVFADPAGRPLDPESVSLRFDRRVKASGLRRIPFHGLRHTFATLALRAGVHPKVVSEILGHANISITLDTYSHAIPAMQEDAADRVASLVFGDKR